VGPSSAFLGSPSQSLFSSDEIISQRSATKASKSAFAYSNREGDGSAFSMIVHRGRGPGCIGSGGIRVLSLLLG